ncbi:NADH dehydrogenase subunit G, partial [Salmonella enterica subsp. enterica serovar Heidelberg str. N189]
MRWASWKPAARTRWWCWKNDLHRHASATRVNAALAKAPLVMVVDHQRTA